MMTVLVVLSVPRSCDGFRARVSEGSLLKIVSHCQRTLLVRVTVGLLAGVQVGLFSCRLSPKSVHPGSELPLIAPRRLMLVLVSRRCIPSSVMRVVDHVIVIPYIEYFPEAHSAHC